MGRHPLWNGKTFVLQVTGAQGSFVSFRVLVSANSGGELFDLRCAVREELVTLLRTRHPEALPKVRTSDVSAVRLPRQEGARDTSSREEASSRSGVDGHRGR